MKMKKDELAAVLNDICQVVGGGDSFEGSIKYSCMEDGLGKDEFEVEAFYRIGNSMGQGGCRLIESTKQNRAPSPNTANAP